MQEPQAVSSLGDRACFPADAVPQECQVAPPSALTGASYFFLNESPILLLALCATHCCLPHKHTEATKAQAWFQMSQAGFSTSLS